MSRYFLWKYYKCPERFIVKDIGNDKLVVVYSEEKHFPKKGDILDKHRDGYQIDDERYTEISENEALAWCI